MATINEVRNRIQELASDGQLTEGELDSLSHDPAFQTPIEVSPGINVQLNDLITQLRDNVRPGEPMSLADLDARLTGFIDQIRGDYSQLAIVRDELGRADVASDPQKKAELETVQLALQDRLAEGLRQATDMARTQNRQGDMDAEWYRAAGLGVPEGVGSGDVQSGNGAMSMGFKAQTAGQSAAQQQAAGQTPFQLPPLWKAQVSGPTIPTEAFMQSQVLDDYALNSFDELLRNQTRGRQMMLLFRQAAQLASSGDPMGMYQFMKFITTVVSKDKGKQLIDQGKKMLELQEMSRNWTQQLLGTKVDANDPNSSTNFTKMMTEVKGETDSIATAQKLLAQTMEETSVVVETLTGVTKSALDFARRAAQKVVSG